MKIEALSGARAAEVAALSTRCFERGWTEEELRRELARPVTLVYVAMDAATDGSEADRPEVMGYAVAYRIGDEVEVLTMGVDPARRRQGIGQALLAALLDGAARSFLEVRRSNAAARALYAAAGFVEFDVREAYYADGEDALVLRLTTD